MIFRSECYNCLIKQAITAARALEVDPVTEERMIHAALDTLKETRPHYDIPDIHTALWPKVFEICGSDDPWKPIKETSTPLAMTWIETLREGVRSADDQLDAAVRMAISGNIIDTATGIPTDVWTEVSKVMNLPLAIDDMDAFREKLKNASSVLYLCDNVGESVFDRVFIEFIHAPVTYVVKGGPILNDVMMEDAHAAGLHEVAAVIDNGTDTLGTQMGLVSEEFLVAWEKADLIISKGMANFETLYDIEEPRLFFLMKVKCEPNASKLGVEKDSIIISQARGY